MAKKKNRRRRPTPMYPIAVGVPERQIPGMLSRKGKLAPPAPRFPGGPPPGTYDPQLDAQLDAAQRGYGDFKFDTQRAGTRATQDYRIQRQDAAINRTRGRRDLATAMQDIYGDFQTAQGDIGREYDRGLFDVTRNRDRGMEDFDRSRDRGLADIGLQRGRTNEDYTRAIDVLNRNYRNLGSAQNQQGRAAGLMGGGFAAQAAAKRAENQEFEKKPLDTSLARALKDLDTSETRLGEDYTRGTGRLREDFNLSTERLGQNRDRAFSGLVTQSGRQSRDVGTQSKRLEQDYNRLLGPQGSPQSGRLYMDFKRGAEDRDLSLQRAGRENRAFGQDIAGTQYYQARYGAGTLPIWNPRRGGPKKRDPYKNPGRRR